MKREEKEVAVQTDLLDEEEVHDLDHIHEDPVAENFWLLKTKN